MREEGAAITKYLAASDADLAIHSLDDVASVIGACYGAGGLLLTEKALGPAFFDLSTGVAGELFQKATNYRLPLALVLPDSSVYGARFSELAYEHRRHPLIRFFRTEAEASAWLQAEGAR